MLIAVEKYTFDIFTSYRWTKSFIANTHIRVATILGWFVRFQAIVVTQTFFSSCQYSKIWDEIPPGILADFCHLGLFATMPKNASF